MFRELLRGLRFGGLMSPFCFIWDQVFGERSARAGCSEWLDGKQLCSLLLPLLHVQLDSALGCSPDHMEESIATGCSAQETFGVTLSASSPNVCMQAVIDMWRIGLTLHCLCLITRFA